MTDCNAVETPAASLLHRCKGQHIRIPDLFDLCPRWKPQINQNFDESVGSCLEKWQNRWCTSPKLLDINQKTNVPFFVQTIYTNAGLGELRTVAKWIAWLFAYDDALDYNDFKDMASERQSYRDDAIRCIQRSMLGSNGNDTDPTRFMSAYPIVQGYYEIGCELRQGVQNAGLCDWDSFDAEDILDIDQYLETRMDTSGIYPSLALYIFTDHISLPRWILELEVTKKLMKLINIIISIDNDMLSVKKELDLGHVDSLVPLLVNENYYSAQCGIDAAAALIRASYVEFCNLESSLYDRVPSEHLHETRRLIQCWKDCRAGSANWHYASKRYYGNSFEQSQVITATL